MCIENRSSALHVSIAEKDTFLEAKGCKVSKVIEAVTYFLLRKAVDGWVRELPASLQ